MLFYVTLGGLFSLYALDLLVLVVVAMVARARPRKTPLPEQMKEGPVYHMESARTMHEAFPKVMIQLPMYNEEAVCDVIIDNCCKIKWPRDRLIIQVCDDSTKEHIRRKVDAAAALAVEAGHPVQVIRRDNRQGYKAGAMVEGLNRLEGQGYEFVAIFDADFEPPEDFLYQAVFPMVADDNIGFVQTRWCYTNQGENFLTWAQKVNLNFHFDVEQTARSYMGWFFNFNGTAGVWRIRTIHDAGGWESDTVVEDMDLSLRAYLKGWKSLYLPHVDNPNELPASLSSYKTQQFRWLSGPMQILNKCFVTVYRAENISFWHKANCYWFFARYVLFAAITLAVLAVPPMAMFVDKWEWVWPEYFFMASINFALAVYLYITPFSIPYLLFSVGIGYFKMWAMLSGLLGSEKSKSWKVTVKTNGQERRFQFHKPYVLELCLALYYGLNAGAAFYLHNWMMLGYCCLMVLIFTVISLGDYFF